MNPLVAFILGLFIGWLIEWVIDWWYWRRKNADRQLEVDASYRKRVTDLEQEVGSYKNQLANLQAERAQMDLPVVTSAADYQSEAEAGYRSRISELEQEVESYKDRLARLEEEQARLSIPVEKRAAENFVMDSPAAEPARVQVRDPLEEIKGIGAALAQRLNLAGIFSFADLAALSPRQLRDMGADSLDVPGSEIEIIKQARLRAGTIKQADDLIVIVGIGPVIARTLNHAGIFTFAELGALSAAELREIVGERIQRLADEEDILAQARQLAEKQSQGG